MKKILVTGGAGYIGSHTVVRLIEQGYQPILLDNFSNSSSKVLSRIEKITGTKPVLSETDISDIENLSALFQQHDFDAVIHFAGLKAVGESLEKPLLYYQNNVLGSVNLFQVMSEFNCKRVVFSSSATVYGDPASVPIGENFPLSVTNPYGETKLIIENCLRALYASDDQWQISILRYFNPIAAHPSGLIGEDPSGTPNNLMPYIAQVGVGKLQSLSVFGDDYDTHDGTGVRDYIHVMDLSDAHLKALQALNTDHACQAYNIGTGVGYSVLQMVTAFEKVSGQQIPYQIKPRRSGDVAQCYACAELSKQRLGWQAKFGIDEMMRDQWNWQTKNPEGY